jgi:phosphotransferase system HPr-like phosphotransfer protein
MMKSYRIMLNSINDVKKFVNAAVARPCDIDVVSGRYIIDAKSIMGIFSIDLSKPVKVEVHGTEEDVNAFSADIAPFIIEDANDD